jgi:hypothetical protein
MLNLFQHLIFFLLPSVLSTVEGKGSFCSYSANFMTLYVSSGAFAFALTFCSTFFVKKKSGKDLVFQHFLYRLAYASIWHLNMQ